MTVTSTITVNRSIRERLFTSPWLPFTKFKKITTTEPSKEIIIMGDVIICHSKTVKVIDSMLKEMRLV